MKEMGGREPKNQPEVYAREILQIEADPVRKLKLQVMQVGELALAAWPNEVFSISGLKLRERTGFARLMNVTLANGAEGYIPPAELHPFGGYTTWPAKTASLGVGAETRIAGRLSGMLDVLKKSKKPVKEREGYWGMEDLGGRPDLRVEGLRAYGVPGKVGRAMYLSKGTVRLVGKKKEYVLEYWMWPVDVRNWVQVRVEQTRSSRKVFLNGQMQQEGPPAQGMLVVQGFEGALDEVELKAR